MVDAACFHDDYAFFRAFHGGETDNSVANTLLPGGGKMAGGALAAVAGCHARQLGNIHLGTGAVARPLQAGS